MKYNQQKNVAQNCNIQPSEFIKGCVWKPLGISMGLMFFQQFTGINAMVFYTTDIFTSAGSTIDCRYATIIIGVVQLLCSVVSGFLVTIISLIITVLALFWHRNLK